VNDDIKVGKTDKVGANFGESSLLCARPQAASSSRPKKRNSFALIRPPFDSVLKSQTLESVKGKGSRQ
jgi:hypothetical protein